MTKMKYLILLTIVGVFGASFNRMCPLDTDTTSNMISAKSDKAVELRLDHSVLRSAFSPDGNIFAASDDRKTLRLWDAKSWAVLRDLIHNDAAYTPIFSPDSTILVTSTGAAANGGLINEKIWFWDVKTGKSLFVYDLGDVKDPISSMVFSPDSKTMAWGTSIGNVKLVDIQDLKNIKTIYEKIDLFNYNRIESMSFSPNGAYLAVASIGVPIIVFDVPTGNEIFDYTDILNSYQITFSPDGQTLAIAGKLWPKDDRKLTVRLFNTESWKMTADLKDHDASEKLGFTPDGNSLIFIGERKVEVYDLRSKRVIKSIKNKYSISAASIAPDGKSVAIGDLMGDTIRIHQISASGK